MRRTVVLCLVPCLFAVATAQATTARLRALGGQGDLLEDDTGVVRWYGSLVDYPQLALLEVGDWDHDVSGSPSDHLSRSGGGLHVRFDREGRWGTAAIYFGEDLPAPDLGGWLRLVWARELGPVALGASFRGTSYSEASSGPPDQVLRGASQFLHDLGLGARWDLGRRCYVDVAGDLRQSDVDYYDNQDGITDEFEGGWDSFGVRGRVFQALGDRAAAVGRVEWRRDVRPVGDAVMDDLVDLDATVLRAGLGFDLLPDPDRLVLASIDYDRREEDRDARHGFYAVWEQGWRLWWRLDVRVGFESRLLPWLSVRGAASYRRTVDETLYFTTWSSDYEERDYDYQVTVRTPVVLGVGLHLGALEADLVLNDHALYDLDLAAAERDAGEDDTYTSLTISYDF